MRALRYVGAVALLVAALLGTPSQVSAHGSENDNNWYQVSCAYGGYAYHRHIWQNLYGYPISEHDSFCGDGPNCDGTIDGWLKSWHNWTYEDNFGFNEYYLVVVGIEDWLAANTATFACGNWVWWHPI